MGELSIFVAVLRAPGTVSTHCTTTINHNSTVPYLPLCCSETITCKFPSSLGGHYHLPFQACGPRLPSHQETHTLSRPPSSALVVSYILPTAASCSRGLGGFCGYLQVLLDQYSTVIFPTLELMQRFSVWMSWRSGGGEGENIWIGLDY